MEPIAIIGIGCRFPQANNPDSFWHLLRNGVSAVTEVPEHKWDVDLYYDADPNTPGKMNTRRGGFLEEVGGFDSDFFGISTDEVEHMDPQQRLFMEVAWEAIENAGIAPKRLSGSNTGVFVGISTIDYHRLLYKNFSNIGPYSGTGTTPCITANRFSYLLDLRGPSMAIDTACSSSLVTVHLACQSLRTGESDLCLAGGVNLILSPDSTISSSQTQILSPQGECKVFDANADGYVRGEGCGVVVLKRLEDALKDEDNILAVIRASAVNQDGFTSSLSAPNGLAQQTLIRRALQQAKLPPSAISYIEAHALGTLIGDAIEFRAIKSVLMENRDPDQPCWINSIKTNIGHLEAAAGISAVIKVALMLQHQEIPPNPHLTELNPHISLDKTSLSIPTKLQKWECGYEKRVAGINAFGFGGTNAHLLLEEAPPPLTRVQSEIERPKHILTLSAKSDAALLELAERYDRLIRSNAEISLADLCFSANTGRSHFNHRLCLVSGSIPHLSQELNAFIHQRANHKVLTGEVKGRKAPKIAFVFPDEVSHSLEIGSQLYETQPILRMLLDKCAQILPSEYSFENNPELKTFCLTYALARLWQSWNVKPSVLMGYGAGEIAAAALAGVFSLEDALKLVAKQEYWRQNSQELAKINYSKPKVPIFSSILGELTKEKLATPDYWINYFRQEKLELVPDTTIMKGYQLCLAIPTKPDKYLETVTCLASLCSGKEDWSQILHTLGNLYIRGVVIDWRNFDLNYSRRRIQLPTYPFQKQHYWFKNIENH